MKLKYLGTAAAEGIPALFCTCPICKKAWEKGGKEVKTRAQALLDDELLIDFGPDTYYHMNVFKVHLEHIHNVIVTHNHEDHFYPVELDYRGIWFAQQVEEEPLHVYAPQSVYDTVGRVIDKNHHCLDNRVDRHLVTPYTPFEVLDYKIVAFKANHGAVDPVNYLINKNGKTLLYAHDTGWFKEETFQYLKENVKSPLNCVSIDSTLGFAKNVRDGHMSCDVVIELVEKLKSENIIDENTIIIANHFSHNGRATHEDLEQFYKQYGILVSYDGMEVNI